MLSVIENELECIQRAGTNTSSPIVITTTSEQVTHLFEKTLNAKTVFIDSLRNNRSEDIGPLFQFFLSKLLSKTKQKNLDHNEITEWACTKNWEGNVVQVRDIATYFVHGKKYCKAKKDIDAVSYTHLTLPTNREV